MEQCQFNLIYMEEEKKKEKFALVSNHNVQMGNCAVQCLKF